MFPADWLDTYPTSMFLKICPSRRPRLSSKACWYGSANGGRGFFTPDESTEQVYILKTGKIQLYRLDLNGQRLVIRRVGQGTISGEMSLFGETVHGCFAKAVENRLVCIANRDEMFQLLRRKPEVALRVLEIVGGRLNTLERRLERLALSPVNSRLADLLLPLAP